MTSFLSLKRARLADRPRVRWSIAALLASMAALALMLLPGGASAAIRQAFTVTMSPKHPTAGAKIRFTIHRASRGRTTGYTVSFGDNAESVAGLRVGGFFQHTYMAAGTYAFHLTIKDAHRRSHPIHKSVVIRPARPRKARWVSLSGDRILASSSTFLLVYDGATLRFIGTTADFDSYGVLAKGLPAGVQPDLAIDDVGFLATDPVPGYPAGLAIATFKGTTPASGLTPAATNDYIESWDALTGGLVSVAEVSGAPANWEKRPIPIQYANGAVSVEVDSPDIGPGAYGRISLTGQVAANVNWPVPDPVVDFSAPDPKDHTGQFGSVQVHLTKGCSQVYLYDMGTLAQTSASPCVGDYVDVVFLNQTTYGLVRDAIPGQPIAPTLYSAATGAQIGTLGGNAVKPIQGPRSTLAFQPWLSPDGTAYVLSTDSWQPVFTIPTAEALNLTAEGVADNDIWVISGGNKIVIAGQTGATVASSWSASPVTGGPGWTVVQGPSSPQGTTNLSLVRSSAPLVADLQSAPAYVTSPPSD